MSATTPPAAHHEAVAADESWGCNEAVLSLLFPLLSPKDLVVARAVNKAWRDIASEPQIRRAAFINHWQLLGCHGTPRQLQFYETAALTSFVWEHQVQRSDSLQMLAVRHGVTVPCLKRVNNLMSDHSLHSRVSLFIPVAGPQQLAGRLVSFRHCGVIKRDFAILLSSQRDSLGQQQQQQVNDALEHQQQHHEGGAGAASSALKVDVLQAKLCQLLGRSLYIDEATAKFYLEDAGGDMKAAMQAFAQDVAWEGTTAGPIRTVPVQRWIRGEMGM